jgi:hypothetical protein
MEAIAWALIFIIGITASIALMLWDIARDRYDDIEYIEEDEL